MNKTLTTLIGVVGVLGATVMLLLGGSSKAADITFIGRGIVKPGGDANSINVYWTQVPASVERIRGVRGDVSKGSSTRYVWTVNSAGTLVKTKTGSLPKPEQEVVIKGVLHSDDRVTAAWIVTNYRQFKITGKIQGITMDTGAADSGWVTISGSSSKFRGVLPSRDFKKAKVVGKDLVVRINGLTAVTSAGNSKTLEEVTAIQQNVTLEGEMLNEDHWAVSKFNEV